MHGSHHTHDHGHDHAPLDFGRAFLIGTLLNSAFVMVEGVSGIVANSMALLADAGHNLSDVLALLIAWGAAALARKRPSARFTYGLRRSSILAALFNAVLLLVAIGAIGFEAVHRLAHPQPIAGGTVIVVAAVGILINGATALMFARGRAHDINIRGAFLHMAADAGISAGVVVAGFVVTRTGWLWLDPAASLAIVAVILVGTWGLLRDSVTMSLDAVPDGIDSAAVTAALGRLPGVAEVHDLHIWAMSTTEIALTAHLLMPGGYPGDGFLRQACAMLDHDFEIEHATLQIETDPIPNCRLAAAEVV